MADEKRIILAKLDIDITALTEAAKKSKKALSDVVDELKKLKNAGQETSREYKEMFETMEALTQMLEDQSKALKDAAEKNIELAATQKEAAKQAKDTAAAHDLLIKSTDAAAQAQDNLSKSMDNAVNGQEKLSTGLKNTADLLNEIEDEAEDAVDAFSEFNAIITEANNMIAQADKATNAHGKTFNDYKKLFKDSANDLDIFNGGLGDFISKAQEAGGAGPFVQKSLSGMATGIGGMTKASLAFIATPIGAVIAAIGVVVGALVSYFKNTQEGIDKVNAIARPMQAIFQSLTGVFQKVGEYLYNAFANPKKTLNELYEFVKQNLINRFTAFAKILEGIMQLDFKKVVNGTIQATTGVEGAIEKIGNVAKETGKFFDEAAKKGQRIDALQKELDKGLADYTKMTSDLKAELRAQNIIADDTTKTMAEREVAAKKSVNTAWEMNQLTLKRLDAEIEILKTKQSLKSATDAEKVALAELIAKRNEANMQLQDAVTTQNNKVKAIKNEGAAEEKRLHDEAVTRNKQKLQDAITLQKQELDLFIQAQGKRALSMEEELKLAKKIADDKMAIAKKEFEIEMSNGKTKEQKQIARNNFMLRQADIETEQAEKRKDAAIAFADSELEKELQKSKTILDSNKFLTDELYSQKVLALDNNLAAEKKHQDTLLQNNAITAQQHQDEITRIENAGKEARKTLDAKKAEDDKSEKLLKLENDRIEAGAAFEYDLATQLSQIEQKRTIELSNENLTAEQKREINLKYDADRKTAEKAVADNKMQLAQQTFGNFATIMGKESAAGKAIAIAQTTIETYKSAVSAYAGMVQAVPGPGGIALGAIAAAASVATGIANVKKITSTKTPKAEKGALFSIGGRRHSEGGTLFTGADGTQFEAEQGELIGVMNRNAARHFMAFNNAFPAGGASAPNYFAGGGIVSREMASPSLNTDELAAKIAEANRALPAPVVAIQDIITEGNSYVQVRDMANF